MVHNFLKIFLGQKSGKACQALPMGNPYRVNAVPWCGGVWVPWWCVGVVVVCGCRGGVGKKVAGRMCQSLPARVAS